MATNTGWTTLLTRVIASTRSIPAMAAYNSGRLSPYYHQRSRCACRLTFARTGRTFSSMMP